MIKKTLEKYIAEQTISIAQAMRRIDENGRGVLFVVEGQTLVGSISDGDIRRWLLKTADFNIIIQKVMNCSPKKIMLGEQKNATELMQRHGINAVPIVDEQNNICDIIFANNIAMENDRNESDLLSGVPVIIMAGGKGTRLYPYTKILPKPLIPIGDIPILERIINRFFEFGVGKYYLTVNYKKGMIKSYFSELNTEYSLEYVEETLPLGTAGSIRLIDEKFERPIFITNCDILIQADYSKIYEYHIQSGNAMTIVAAMKHITVPYGVLNIKENGVVTSMDEKPSMEYFINTGMYIINPDVIQKIPEDTFFHMTHLAEALIQDGRQVGMYPISEELFLDMGEFEEMRRMEEKLHVE